MAHAVSVRRVRRQRNGGLEGYIVTWDVDSKDAALRARLRRFIFGYTSDKGGRRYVYAGLLTRPDVRYLGQSVVFVTGETLSILRSYLRDEGIDHVVILASIGAILPS